MAAKLHDCVYVLLSHHDRKLYIGFTTDLKRRLTDHFHGEVASAAHRRPLELVHCEYYRSEADAIRREGYLKTTKAKRALRLMLRETFADLQGSSD